MQKSPVISKILKPYTDTGAISGAVTLVATKDKIIHHEAFGYADIEADRRMVKDSLFWIASMTKPMTCTALMMLVDEGKVNVDDPVEKYLPEFKGQMVIAEKDENHVLLKKPQHPPLVRNILSHTSGLPFRSSIETPTFDMHPLRVAVQSYAMSQLEFEPDSKFQYSNEGTNTVGRIIEVVSGIPYEEFLDERLLIPLGMKNTSFWPKRKRLKRLAEPYKTNPETKQLEKIANEQLATPFENRDRYPLPAGGLFSTAKDCAKFAQMILNGGILEERRYISESSLKMMTSRQTSETIQEGYGFGWFVESDGTFGHGGAYRTDMSINPKSEIATVFMFQQANDWPLDEANKIVSKLKSAAATLAKEFGIP